MDFSEKCIKSNLESLKQTINLVFEEESWLKADAISNCEEIERLVERILQDKKSA